MKAKITKIGITNNKISARRGLSLFLSHTEQIGLYNMISGVLNGLFSTNNKGLQLEGFLKQMIAFFMEGTNMAIRSFDDRKKDEGYAAIMESTREQLASSHQIKRYLFKLSVVTNCVFNKILNELLVWRLRTDKPSVIELGIDTMVMDNDGASKLESNEVTYKRKKGYQPLYICWGTLLVVGLYSLSF